MICPHCLKEIEENFIIENYNYDNFKNEPLYSKMKKFNLT